MNRLNEERSIVSWNVASGAVTTLRNTGLIGTWTLTRDGSAITVQEDITKKTDYDVIGGREWKLVTQRAGEAAREVGGEAAREVGGEAGREAGGARTLFPTLKGVTLSWADDGQHFATGRDGRVFIGSIADTLSRQLLGPAMPARGAAAPAAAADTSPAARALRARERFTVVRWSPAGDALIASNGEGLWLVDVASGNKEMVIAVPDSNTVLPRTALATLKLPLLKAV